MVGSLFGTLLAAGCAASSSFCIRKNAEYSPHANGYLWVHYFICLLLSLAIYPELFKTAWNPAMMFIGALTGLFIVVLMQITSRAISCGPTGLTFAFLNASSIFPALILFFLFGKDFGFSVTIPQIGGMLLVIGGLLLASRSNTGKSAKISREWLKYAIACFFLQTCILTLFKWRCLLFTCDTPHLLIPQGFTEQDDFWFMPGVFGMANLAQGILFLRERRRLQWSEMGFGVLGGIANASSTILLLLSTKWANSPTENALLFPIFAVATLVSCNLWARAFYKEEFNILANALCCIGIFIGSIS